MSKYLRGSLIRNISVVVVYIILGAVFHTLETPIYYMVCFLVLMISDFIYHSLKKE